MFVDAGTLLLRGIVIHMHLANSAGKPERFQTLLKRVRTEHLVACCEFVRMVLSLLHRQIMSHLREFPTHSCIQHRTTRHPSDVRDPIRLESDLVGIHVLCRSSIWYHRHL